MNILADKSIDKQIVDYLRGNGFPVNYVAEMNPGITDKEVSLSLKITLIHPSILL